jgi:hypothetical protein
LNDLNQKKDELFQMVEQFIIDCRGSGVQLPYSDLAIILGWIEATAKPDLLLVALADLIPEYFEKNATRRIPPSLKGIDRSVQRRVRELSTRRLNAFSDS